MPFTTNQPSCSFQGETGAFSELAVEALFDGARPVATPSFEGVFADVSSGKSDRGVIPIENSLFGSVHINYDLLREHELRIVGEVKIRIRHCLLGMDGATTGSIRQVHSHPQALGQCRTWLRENLPGAEDVPAYDTAGAARMIAAMGVNDVAAIASERAAAEYGLTVLARGIETNPNNYTRFLALARPEDVSADRVDGQTYKTTILYSLKSNVPGALFKTLAVFALRDVDLIKIESRPLVGQPGQYLFYIDVDGHADDEHLQRAIGHLGELTTSLTILGSYPTGATIE